MKKIGARMKKNNFFKYYFGTSFPFRRYFKKHKVIFIHIPKTAGTSILSILSNNKKYHRDHLTWDFYSRVNRWRFNKYYKFTFVRNPYDKMVSTYEYLANGGNQMDDIEFQEYFKENSIDFEKFVLEFLSWEKLQEHILFKPQYLFIYDFHGNCKVDFIGHYESIEQDFSELAKKLNLTEDKLPKKNVSKRKKSYLSYYSNPCVVRKIQELYAKDFQLLGYDASILAKSEN